VEYTKVSVEELRDALVGFGMDEVEVSDIKGKSNLVKKHREMSGEPIVAEATELVVTNEEKPVAPTRPDYTSPEWEQFVLSQLTDREKDKEGHPRVAGLRRLTEKLLGPIVCSGPVETKSYETESSPGGKAVVTFSVTIEWMKDGVEFGLTGPLEKREYRAVASCTRFNSDDAFCVYPEAIAETRAEARALRRALRLSTVSADEITQKDTGRILEEYVANSPRMAEGPSTMITDQQKLVIQNMCNKLKVDLMGFLNNGTKQYTSIDEVSRETATKMIARLNAYQTTGTSESVSIPEKLKVE